jgi:conjugal transfer/entry exclusion protein
MVYQARGALATFDQLFTNGDMPFSIRGQAILNEIRSTSRLATEVQSVYDRLCATTRRTEQLTNASQAAVGALQAVQAGNQLQAVLIEQQQGMAEVQATTARLQTMMAMKEIVEDEAMKAKADRWIEGWPTSLGAVQGFKLP